MILKVGVVILDFNWGMRTSKSHAKDLVQLRPDFNLMWKFRWKYKSLFLKSTLVWM